jgi:hypothetical protein
MEINYCLKKGKGKGNLYLPSFVVTLFCRRALMSSRSYVAALLCRRALMSPRSYVARSFVARSFCGALLSRYRWKRLAALVIKFYLTQNGSYFITESYFRNGVFTLIASKLVFPSYPQSAGSPISRTQCFLLCSRN